MEPTVSHPTTHSTDTSSDFSLNLLYSSSTARQEQFLNNKLISTIGSEDTLDFKANLHYSNIHLLRPNTEFFALVDQYLNTSTSSFFGQLFLSTNIDITFDAHYKHQQYQYNYGDGNTYASTDILSSNVDPISFLSTS